MAILLSVVFGLLLYPIHVAGLTPCHTDGTLEVVESTENRVFTCTGAVSTDLITWILLRSNKNTILAACTIGSCNNPHKPRFEASRPADDRSTLTVNVSTTSYMQYVQGQTIACKITEYKGENPGNSQQTQCTMDIVAVPSVTCDAHYNTGTSSPWTVTGNCSVSRAYSYLNRYTCNLTQTSPTTKSLGSGNLVVTSTSGSGGKYKTGYCQVTVAFPDVTGVYSYKMAVNPGRQDVPASFGGQRSFGIKRPSTPPSHNCPQYVGESQGTSCTCTATDLGQPAGVVRWTSTLTNQLSLSNVNVNNNGTKHTCEVVWNGQRTQSVTYTLQVAYGPSNVSITHPPFPFDTNGQQQLNFTCSASDVNPAPTFTWSKGSANNVVGQGRTYTFRPQPPGDDNSVFVCRAVNNVTGTSRQDNTTLTLNYPPAQDPVITITSTPSNSGGHLYQGDRVTLTCAVTGGKPFGATTVIFTCPEKQDSPGIVGSSGVTSTVTFDSLNTSDHDTVCTCTTSWNNTNWYNKSETVRLFVNSSTYIDPEPEPKSGFPVGAVVGAIVAVLVVSAIIVVVVLVIRRRRDERQKPPSTSSPGIRDREEPGDDFMITNTAYVSSEDAGGTATSNAPQRNQPSTSQAISSPYEDVDVPNAKPVIKPKPKSEPQHGASAAQVATTGDVYATVNKKNGPQSAPQDSSPVYAVVNKKKKAPAELPTATQGAMKEKPKVGKKPASKKPKQKGKGKKETKKEDELTLDPAQSTSSNPGAVYGNVTPLSMSPPPPPPEGSVYANVGFQRDDSAGKDHKPEPEPEGSRTVNPDGLVYITIGFSEEQRKKANDPPPERVTTNHAALDYSKMETQ